MKFKKQVSNNFKNPNEENKIMKKSAGFLVLISLVFGVAVYFSMDSSKKKVAQKTLLSISKSSIGSEEDPSARARF
ncbi:hypothetical protein IH785_15780, partial [candidate division KSB1 bacterium]|nr:hypothetical protein [candidate division KSB1 bacterium]